MAARARCDTSGKRAPPTRRGPPARRGRRRRPLAAARVARCSGWNPVRPGSLLLYTFHSVLLFWCGWFILYSHPTCDLEIPPWRLQKIAYLDRGTERFFIIGQGNDFLSGRTYRDVH